MIVLDTNIVSEFMTSPPQPPVLAWLNAQDVGSLYLTSISISEIDFGLRVLPDGKRRRRLQERFEQFNQQAFDTRIVSFDESAAHICAEIRAQRRKLGRPISNFDAQIAAIARSLGFAVATRNTKDFEDCGLQLINPFVYKQ